MKYKEIVSVVFFVSAIINTFVSAQKENFEFIQ